MKKILKIINNLLGVVLFLFFLFVGATFLPIPGNYKAFTVQSGSMEPAIKMGSLIFVKPFENYNPGDIITFQAKGGKTTVTHRIVEKKEQENGVFFETKGDANEEADTQSVARDTVIGKVFLTLPWVGFPVSYAKTKMGFIILILIPSIIIIYEELRGMAGEIRKKIGRIKQPEKGKYFAEEEDWFIRPENNIRILDYSVGIEPRRHCSPPLPPAPFRRKKV